MWDEDEDEREQSKKEPTKKPFKDKQTITRIAPLRIQEIKAKRYLSTPKSKSKRSEEPRNQPHAPLTITHTYTDARDFLSKY